MQTVPSTEEEKHVAFDMINIILAPKLERESTRKINL